MFESSPITVLDECEGRTNLGDNDEIVSFNLNALGKPVHLQVGVKDKQARLADIVPAARVLSSRIVETTMKRLQDIGTSVPCHKGCAACCSYYLVSISVPELFRLVQETAWKNFQIGIVRRNHLVLFCAISYAQFTNKDLLPATSIW